MSLNKPIWKLRNWIPEKKLEWFYVAMNSNATQLLLDRKNWINPAYLALNPNVLDIIHKTDWIDWFGTDKYLKTN